MKELSLSSTLDVPTVTPRGSLAESIHHPDSRQAQMRMENNTSQTFLLKDSVTCSDQTN